MPEHPAFSVSSLWVQGATVLPTSLATEPIISALALSNDDLLIVITQSCDVVHRSLADEPFVELLIARCIPSVDGNYTFGKNPRTFDFQRDASSYRCQIREKVALSRTVLIDKEPADCISSEIMWCLGRWAGKRYSRPAFPDEFNVRLKPAMGRIRRILERGGVNITGLYFSLDTDEELSSLDSYKLIVYITVKPSTEANVALLVAATNAAAQLHEAINRCEKIEVLETSLKSEADVSLFDLRDMPRFDFDYVTVRWGGEIVPE